MPAQFYTDLSDGLSGMLDSDMGEIVVWKQGVKTFNVRAIVSRGATVEQKIQGQGAALFVHSSDFVAAALSVPKEGDSVTFDSATWIAREVTPNNRTNTWTVSVRLKSVP
jgi:hypothetical protein